MIRKIQGQHEGHQRERWGNDGGHKSCWGCDARGPRGGNEGRTASPPGGLASPVESQSFLARPHIRPALRRAHCLALSSLDMVSLFCSIPQVRRALTAPCFIAFLGGVPLCSCSQLVASCVCSLPYGHAPSKSIYSIKISGLGDLGRMGIFGLGIYIWLFMYLFAPANIAVEYYAVNVVN